MSAAVAVENQGAPAGAPCVPAASLTTTDAVALVVGVVVGAGIFRLPSLVAGNVSSAGQLLGFWLLGGLLSVAGALCYAELTIAWPHPGGDYHYLDRAFGRPVAFLFAWARLTVIQTGSIAAMAFIFGDYAAQAVGCPGWSPAGAAAGVVALTAVNLCGARPCTRVQLVLTVAKAIGLGAVVLAGLAWAAPTPAAGAPPPTAHPGLALVFVLFAFGGWNEAAYLSAELHRPQRAFPVVVLLSLGLITALYLFVNLACLRVLGLSGMAGSAAVAVDLCRAVGADRLATLVAAMVALSAIGAANAAIFTGARAVYAVGADHQSLAVLAAWRRDHPRSALLGQGVVAVALIVLGAVSRRGFETMVDYTAPVFWLFFLLVGLSVFRLRRTEPAALRPFRVPGYPVTPLLFCSTAAYMLWATIRYAGLGTIAGLLVLAAGVPVMLWSQRRGVRR